MSRTAPGSISPTLSACWLPQTICLRSLCALSILKNGLWPALFSQAPRYAVLLWQILSYGIDDDRGRRADQVRSSVRPVCSWGPEYGRLNASARSTSPPPTSLLLEPVSRSLRTLCIVDFSIIATSKGRTFASASMCAVSRQSGCAQRGCTTCMHCGWRLCRVVVEPVYTDD